jgi:cytochrome c biogenesis protein CcdA/glutaredoxin
MSNKLVISLSLSVIILVGLFYFYFQYFPITGNAIAITPPSGESVPIMFFYGQGCSHCAAAEEFFKSIENKYNLDIEAYEIYSNKDNVNLLIEMASAYGQEVKGIPAIFIDGKVFVGYGAEIGRQIEAEIKKCSLNKCPNPINVVSSENLTAVIGNSSPTDNPLTSETKKKLTIPAVILAAAIDSINPCEFAVLILLLTTILASGSRKRAFFAGLAFSAAIYISYFLMGLGLYSAIQISGFTRIFYIIVSIVAIVVGLFNVKDYFWYGKWFVMEVPLTWRPKMKMLLRSVTSIPGAFFIGVVISLFLLPCTSGPYIVILGLLAELTTRNYAMMLLLLYNAIFIIPMLVITGVIAFGFATTEQAEEWRQRKIKALHLITGALMIILGVVMLGAVLLGYL